MKSKSIAELIYLSSRRVGSYSHSMVNSCVPMVVCYQNSNENMLATFAYFRAGELKLIPFFATSLSTSSSRGIRTLLITVCLGI
jgi:hypothetical protein